jgi:glyoxylase-like metal-dependent hydrolase (beta-lactamase superfamily II)
MYLIPVPAFADNYLWLLHDGKRALVVDPGDAEPALRTLAQHGLQLESILVTHHHADHTTGVDALREVSSARVFGPATEQSPRPFMPTSIAPELLINPFLRTRQAPVMAATRRFDASALDDNTVFAAVRQ